MIRQIKDKCQSCGSKKDIKVLFCKKCLSYEKRDKTFRKRIKIIIAKAKKQHGGCFGGKKCS